MYCFKNVIDEIESKIADDIDIEDLARKANMSVYEFRRIFTYLAGIPYGEYVRKRRLSLAATELYDGGKSIAYISGKYGYDSLSSFTRAFKDFHGLSPSEVIKGNGNFKLLTRINTEIITTGGKSINYSIVKKQGFVVGGYCGISSMADTECCENVWEGFYSSEYAGKIRRHSSSIYAVYDNGKDFVRCYIGAIGGNYAESIEIPESEWACFKLFGTDDDYVNKFYTDVLNQWFSSLKYRKNNDIPNIEVFPTDMSGDKFEWEIWIPVIKGVC